MIYSNNTYSIFISPPDFMTHESFELHEEKLLNCWIDSSKIFKCSEFEFDGHNIIIETDWKKIKKQFKYSIDHKGELLLSIKIDKATSLGVLEFFIIRFLEMMFITMNLAVPGSLNIYKKELKATFNENNFKNEEISLSSGPFEFVWETSEKLNHWPKIDFLSLEKTVEWYKSLDIMFKQKATTNIERCIFSLINFCHEPAFSPSDFIWLTHSLEALYDTPREGILNSLKQRLFLFLGTPNSHNNEIKKKITSLYDLRSKFVHGTMEVVREPSNEILDSSLNQYMEEMNLMNDFGMMLIVSTMQKMIDENSKGLLFTEQYKNQS